MKKTPLAFILLLVLPLLLTPSETVQGASYTTFGDVPANHWAWEWIESLYQAKITGGCRTNPLFYCPSNSVTRAQMAVFLLRGMHDSTYTPPPATGTIFGDVTDTNWFFSAWIEQLYNEGITGGCGGGNYCPNNSVTRAQMAVFLLRAKYGFAYTPPPATGTIFGDVTDTGWFFSAWIEQLYAEGITGGCGTNPLIYCPDKPVTRAEMAIFLVKTFNLPLIAQPPGPAFPRLGMFWPRPDQQPHAAIARYDWVVLADAAGIYIDELRQINPTMFILNSTDAHEVSYSPYDPAIQEIPYQWYLTQVGTTLRSAVNATQTVLPVNAVEVSGYDLFLPGETALIEGESVLVQSVDTVNKTITVQRGFVRPASSHAAGTRIAAHISFWENSWVLNVSTLSPLGVADPLYGPERWSDYHARATAALLDDPGWDGILVDGANPTQSSLLYNSNARTIDPDQSNTLLTDYSAFDAAWTEGMTHYLQQLRNAVGPDPIIYQNQGTPAFDIVNGSNFEAFPQDTGDSYFSGWHTTVFGPLNVTKSYFEWLDNALQPNLTMVETYEDDYGIIDSYNNPCNDPGFTPNYQKMRFGLTTALMGDGYFSYEMSTNGHGSLCLMWFDEYDNAGAGRGYLGYPLAPAYQVFAPPSTLNLVAGGGLNTQSDTDLWSWIINPGYARSWALDTTERVEGAASMRATVTQTAGEEWGVLFDSSPVTITAGSEYTLTFWAKADQERHISAWVQQHQSPYQKSLVFDTISLSTEWTKYQLSEVASFSSQGTNLKLRFALSEITGNVWLDDVRLQLGGVDVWRRDFDNGIALVNATSQPVNIPLGGTFRKINGTQVPAINNGSLVTSVTLQPLDGIILLRP